MGAVLRLWIVGKELLCRCYRGGFGLLLGFYFVVAIVRVLLCGSGFQDFAMLFLGGCGWLSGYYSRVFAMLSLRNCGCLAGCCFCIQLLRVICPLCY